MEFYFFNPSYEWYTNLGAVVPTFHKCEAVGN